jgi:hypothetical protein
MHFIYLFFNKMNLFKRFVEFKNIKKINTINNNNIKQSLLNITTQHEKYKNVRHLQIALKPMNMFEIINKSRNATSVCDNLHYLLFVKFNITNIMLDQYIEDIHKQTLIINKFQNIVNNDNISNWKSLQFEYLDCIQTNYHQPNFNNFLNMDNKINNYHKLSDDEQDILSYALDSNFYLLRDKLYQDIKKF